MSGRIFKKNHLVVYSILSALVIPFIVSAAEFVNPLRGDTTISGIVIKIIDWLLGMAALLALLSLVIGGVRLIFGGFDNEAEAARAKKIILWAIIGLSVVILSLVMLNILRSLLQF